VKLLSRLLKKPKKPAAESGAQKAACGFASYPLTDADCDYINRCIERGDREISVPIIRNADNAKTHYNGLTFPPDYDETAHQAYPQWIEQYRNLPAYAEKREKERIRLKVRPGSLSLLFYGHEPVNLDNGAEGAETSVMEFAKYLLTEADCEYIKRHIFPQFQRERDYQEREITVLIKRNADNVHIHYDGAEFPPEYQWLKWAVCLTRIEQYRLPSLSAPREIHGTEQLCFISLARPASVIWLDGGKYAGISAGRREGESEPGDDEYYLQNQPWLKPLAGEWLARSALNKSWLLKQKDGGFYWRELAYKGYAEKGRNAWADWERRKFSLSSWKNIENIDFNKWRYGAAIAYVPTYQRELLPEKGVFELRVPKNAGAKFFKDFPWIPVSNAGDFLFRCMQMRNISACKTETAEDYIYHVPFYEYFDFWHLLFWLEYPILYEYGLLKEPMTEIPGIWSKPDADYWKRMAALTGDKF